MVERIEIKQDFGEIKKGTVIEFNSNNMIVLLGRSGSGKSTIIDAVADSYGVDSFPKVIRPDIKELVEVSKTEGVTSEDVIHHDGHSHNRKHSVSFEGNFEAQMQSLKQSSGQSSVLYCHHRGIFSAKNKLLLLDEIDAHSDIFYQFQIWSGIYHKAIEQNSCKIIMATHSMNVIKWLYEKQDVLIYDLEAQGELKTDPDKWVLNNAMKNMPTSKTSLDFLSAYDSKYRKTIKETMAQKDQKRSSKSSSSE